MAFNVFVSHSVKPDDLPIIQQMCDRLRPHGFHCTLATRSVKSAEAGAVEDALCSADCVLAFMTQDGTATADVNRELDFAMKMRKAIFPVVEKGVDVSGLPPALKPVEIDSDAPDDCATKLSGRLTELKASHEARQGIFWAIIVTVGTIFSGRGKSSEDSETPGARSGP